MQYYKNKGIVLHALKFKDFDQILTIYTRDEGIIKLLVKGAYSQKQSKGSAVDVLSEIECVYGKRQSTLYTCQEKSIVNHHLALRKTLTCLESACGIAKAVLDSQPEHKPSPLLYDLLICYLNQLPSASNPSAFEISFLLKILRIEGLLGLTPQCTVCRTDLIEHFVFHGESFCSQHAPQDSIQLSPFEAASVFTLAFSRSLPLIESTPAENTLKSKIQQLFVAQLNN